MRGPDAARPAVPVGTTGLEGRRRERVPSAAECLRREVSARGERGPTQKVPAATCAVRSFWASTSRG